MAKPAQDPSPSQLPPAADDADAQQQIALLKSLLVTVQHFFGGFGRLFSAVIDPRHPIYITYPLASVLATGVLLFLLRLGARRQVTLLLRQNGPSAAKFQALFGVETVPHGDTLEATYKRLQVPEVQEVVTTTVETLIRKKVLYRYRLCGHYYLVIIDGTGMLTFAERHCPDPQRSGLSVLHDDEAQERAHHLLPSGSGGQAGDVHWLRLLSDDRVHREPQPVSQ